MDSDRLLEGLPLLLSSTGVRGAGFSCNWNGVCRIKQNITAPLNSRLEVRPLWLKVLSEGSFPVEGCVWVLFS
jgi:hypothetical protein